MLLHRAAPFLGDYHVLSCDAAGGPLTATEEAELLALADSEARRLGTELFGDPGCFALVFSGERTRRRGWAHVHLIPAPDVSAKRRRLALFFCRHTLARVLRWTGLGLLLDANPPAYPRPDPPRARNR